jgi:hypothetical protein
MLWTTLLLTVLSLAIIGGLVAWMYTLIKKKKTI